MNTPEPEPISPERLACINIINALRRGTVPAGGLERIAVGTGIEEEAIGRQLDYVAQGGGDAKFIRGEYGSGKTFLVARALEIARSKGVSAYVGDGSGRWPAVHRLDAARLYRLALEQAPAGSVFHAVAEEGVPTRDIAEVIGRHLDLPVVSIALEDAGEHFGWIGAFFAADIPASSALTRERLGWEPAHRGLIADLEAGHYFAHAPVA